MEIYTYDLRSTLNVPNFEYSQYDEPLLLLYKYAINSGVVPKFVLSLSDDDPMIATIGNIDRIGEYNFTTIPYVINKYIQQGIDITTLFTDIAERNSSISEEDLVFSYLTALNSVPDSTSLVNSIYDLDIMETSATEQYKKYDRLDVLQLDYRNWVSILVQEYHDVYNRIGTKKRRRRFSTGIKGDIRSHDNTALLSIN